MNVNLFIIIIIIASIDAEWSEVETWKMQLQRVRLWYRRVLKESGTKEINKSRQTDTRRAYSCRCHSNATAIIRKREIIITFISIYLYTIILFFLSADTRPSHVWILSVSNF